MCRYTRVCSHVNCKKREKYFTWKIVRYYYVIHTHAYALYYVPFCTMRQCVNKCNQTRDTKVKYTKPRTMLYEKLFKTCNRYVDTQLTHIK